MGKGLLLFILNFWYLILKYMTFKTGTYNFNNYIKISKAYIRIYSSWEIENVKLLNSVIFHVIVYL